MTKTYFRETINDFSGGMIEYTDVPEKANQMTLMRDCYPDKAQGVLPLPPEREIRELDKIPFDNAVKIHTYVKNSSESYHIFVQRGMIKVFDKDFNELNLLDFNQSSYYIKASYPNTQVTCTTVGDTTFISDSTVTVKRKIKSNSTRVDYNLTPFIWIKQAAPGTEYTINLEVSGKVAAVKASYTSSTDKTKATNKAILEGLFATLKAQGHNYILDGSLLIFKGNEVKKVTVSDTLGGNGIIAVGKEVSDISELPKVGPKGRVVSVSPLKATQIDNYYLHFDGENWREIFYEPVSTYEIDADTMPRMLKKNAEYNRYTQMKFITKDLKNARMTFDSDLATLSPGKLNGYVFFNLQYCFIVNRHLDRGELLAKFFVTPKTIKNNIEFTCAGHQSGVVLLQKDKYKKSNNPAENLPSDTFMYCETEVLDVWVGKKIYDPNTGILLNVITGVDKEKNLIKFEFVHIVQDITLCYIEGMADYFVLDKFDWKPRIAGNNDNNPLPNFVGRKITSLFYWKDRLGIVSGENVSLSRQSEYGQFHRTTTSHYDDLDAINISLIDEMVSPIHHVMTFQEYVLFFSTNSQFKIEGSPLSVRTIQSTLISREHIKASIRPIRFLNMIIAVTPDDRLVALREGNDRTLRSIELSENVREQLEINDIHSVFPLQQLGAIAVSTELGDNYICFLKGESPTWIRASKRGQTYYEYVENNKIYRIVRVDDRVKLTSIMLYNRYRETEEQRSNENSKLIIPIVPRDREGNPRLFDRNKIHVRRIHINGICSIDSGIQEDENALAEFLGVVYNQNNHVKYGWLQLDKPLREIVLTDIRVINNIIIEGYYHD